MELEAGGVGGLATDAHLAGEPAFGEGEAEFSVVAFESVSEAEERERDDC